MGGDVEQAIRGTTMPVLEVSLASGESVISESGAFSWMTSSIDMRTTTQIGGASGIMGVFKRAVAGGGIFMTELTAKDGPGTVSFAARLPGQIIPIDVEPNRFFMAHSHGFLCGESSIELTIGFQQKLGAGIFGGAGFILQKVQGKGTAWVQLSGEIFVRDLAAGETLRVHPGHVGMFDDSITFDIVRVKGIKNIFFGADTLFMASLTGPGRIWLQTLTLSHLAHDLDPFISHPEGGSGGGLGGIGRILGGE